MNFSTEAVIETIREMYAAAAIDDEAHLAKIFTEDFYAFDGGKRFDGMALPRLIKAAHAAGKHFVWTVNEPTVWVAQNWASIAFINRGSVGDADGTTPVTWQESAVLKFDGKRWRVQFFHSNRVPAEG